MRVTKYKTKLTIDGEVILEKESSVNYVGASNILGSPKDVYNLATDVFRMHEETEEYAYILCLNVKNKLISAFEVSHGSVNMSVIGVREILVKALLSNAVNLILIHNHPSGDPTPSKEDKNITIRLREAGNIIGVTLLDHLIIGNGRYCSLKEKDLI